MDALEPGFLCGESGGAAEILNLWFYVGEIVDFVDRFHYTWEDVVENFMAGEHFSCLGDRVDGVKELGSGGSINEESVYV